MAQISQRSEVSPSVHLAFEGHSLGSAAHEYGVDSTTLTSLLDGVSQPVVVIDPTRPSFPLVSVSAGFVALTGHKLEYWLGEGVDKMIQGVPLQLRSKSAKLDQTSFLMHSALEGAEAVACETRIVHVACREDGSLYTMLCFYGICVLRRKRYVLVCIKSLGDDLAARITAKKQKEGEEEMREVFREVRFRLRKNLLEQRTVVASDFTSGGSFTSVTSTSAEAAEIGAWADTGDETNTHASGQGGSCNFSEGLKVHRRDKVLACDNNQPLFEFYDERLQHHCLLMSGCHTVERREANELASGCCMVFSSRPLAFSKAGLTYRVRVDKVAEISGLPFLGITRREPEDTPDLYPSVAKCCGASAMAGGCLEAHVRDQHEHFQIGFKVPPKEQVETWQLLPKGAPHPKVAEGDILTLLYTWAGRLQLLRNGEAVVDVDTGRPLDTGCVHYAVIDVCFSAAKLSVLPNETEVAKPGASPHVLVQKEEVDRQMVEALIKGNNQCQSRTMGSIDTAVPSNCDASLEFGVESAGLESASECQLGFDRTVSVQAGNGYVFAEGEDVDEQSKPSEQCKVAEHSGAGGSAALGVPWRKAAIIALPMVTAIAALTLTAKIARGKH